MRNKQQLKYFFDGGMLLLLLFFLLPAIPVHPVGAQITPTTDVYKELDDKIKTFFASIISGNSNTTAAFDNLLLQSPLGSTSAVAEIRTKLEETKKQVGEFQDYENYQAKSIGKDIVQIKYILKGEYYPIIWTFTFYRKPPLQSSTGNQPGPWQIVEMRFDSNLDL